ncbi:hypothetical protein M3Y99_00063900 [Aphelenchoides fujianensis]|nr:hypothetical protein M3Y99_00063900 [Aphelenchoides fujianensis]
MTVNSDAKMDALLEKYEGAFEVTDQGKLRCTLTEHELPYRFEDLEKYVQNAKFVRAFEMKQVLDEYGQYFEEFGKKGDLLGCKLTMRTLAKDGKTLRNHVNGQKFKNALKRELEKKADEQKAGEEAADKMDVAEDDAEEPAEQKKTPRTPKAKAGTKRPKSSGTRRNAVKKAKV